MAPLPLSKAAPIPPTTPNLPSSTSTKKRKRNAPSTPQPHILHQSTFRRPPHTLLHLRLTSTSTPNPTNLSADLDPLTFLQSITAALHSYLGVTGAAIPLDVMKIEGRDVWVRCQMGDERGLRAGVGEWVGAMGGGKVGLRVIGGGDGGEGVFGG